MRDTISIQRVSQLHPKIRDEVKILIDQVEATMPADTSIRVVQGLRTIAEQDAIYAKGRTAPGAIVTKARGGKSYHNYGTAFDYCTIKNGKISWEVYQPMVAIFKAAGYTWGGDFQTIVDKPHFQKSFGKTVKQLFAMYNAKQFIPGTQFVDI